MNSSVQPFDGHTISQQTIEFLNQSHGVLIDGEWHFDGRDTLLSKDPATGLDLTEVALGSAADANAAVSAARAAFNGEWSSLSAQGRAKLLSNLARSVEQNTQLFVELEVLDSGMPLAIAQLTISNIVEMIDYYAGAVLRIEGTTTSPPRHLTDYAEAFTYTLKEPVGVVGLIIPWNVPVSTLILKLAPALAAGCTAVVKPSEETPLTAILLGHLIVDAGFPNGVVNILNGRGSVVGAALSAHIDVDKVSFTGSTAVGKKIIHAAADNLKKVTLELGGKSPVVVLPDADLAVAVPGVAMATFFLQGQNCMAGTRIFVHEDIHDDLVAGLVQFSQSMVLSHGLSPETQLGPLVSAAHCEKVLAYIASGVEQGATLVTGGHRLPRPGNFVAPAIFTDVKTEHKIMREEIFGPVMSIQKFNSDDVDEIAALANNTDYGLSGSVWTQNLSAAHRLVARIRAGHVSINCHGAVGTNIPFGGYGQSGWGREFGQEGLDAYLETKAVTALL